MNVKRPVFYVGDDCLRHWSYGMCLGCVYEGPEFDIPGRFWWRVRQPFRALFYRLFARIEYPDWW